MPSDSTVLNPWTFRKVCEAQDPMEWAVGLFCEEVSSPSLIPFAHAYVSDVYCFHRKGGVSHEYIILCIRMRERFDQFGETIWARCERNPHGLPKGAPAAKDTVKLSYNRQKLKGAKDDLIAEANFDNLQVLHVADLLNTIHTVSPNYGLGSHNCWWFAAVISGTLQVFGSDWTMAPNKHWTKRAVEVVGKDTKNHSAEIRRRYISKWNTTGALPVPSLSELGAWNNGAPRGHLRTGTVDISQQNNTPPIQPGLYQQYQQPTQPIPIIRIPRPLPEIPSRDQAGIPQRILTPRDVYTESPPSVSNLSLPPVTPPSASDSFHNNIRNSEVSLQPLPHSRNGHSNNEAGPSSHPPTPPPKPLSKLPDRLNTILASAHEGPPPDNTLRDDRSQYSQTPSENRAPHHTASLDLQGSDTLGDVVLRAISSTDNWRIVLAVYPAFTSARLLLRGLVDRYKFAPPEDTYTRHRILTMVREWVSSKDFDRSLGSEVENFLEKRVLDQEFANPDVEPIFRTLSVMHASHPEYLRHSSDVSSSSELSSPISPLSSGFFNTLSTSPRSTKKLRGATADSLLKMNDKEIGYLAHELEAMELEERSRLTVLHVVKWLAWRCAPPSTPGQARKYWPDFSLITDKIGTWVLDSILQGSIDHRALTYQKFVRLANECCSQKNLASADDLNRALQSRHVTRLTYTMQLGNDKATRKRLNSLHDSLVGNTVPKLTSINPQINALIPLLPVTNERGEIVWSRCVALHTHITQVITPYLNTPPVVDQFNAYRTFIQKQQSVASYKRGTIASRSETIFTNESLEWKRRADAGAGMT